MYIILNKKKLNKKNRITFSYEKEEFGKFLPVLSIFNYWNKFGEPLIRHRINPNSKIYKRVEKMLHQILKKYTIQKIKNSIKNYYNLLSSENTILSKMIPGHIVGLNEFFGFSNFTKQRMQRAKVKLNIKSWFEECLKGKGFLEKSYGDYVVDYYPTLTKEFIRLWWIYSDLDEYKLSIKEINYFRKSSFRYVKWWGKNSKNLKIYSITYSIESFIECIYKSIQFDIGDQSWEGLVSLGWLCSDKTYVSRLPMYLKQLGILKKEKKEKYNVVY